MIRQRLSIAIALAGALIIAQGAIAQDGVGSTIVPLEPEAEALPVDLSTAALTPPTAFWTESDPVLLFDVDPTALEPFDPISLEVSPPPTMIRVVTLGMVRSIGNVGTYDVGPTSRNGCKAFDGSIALQSIDAAFRREGLQRRWSRSTPEVLLVTSAPVPDGVSPTTFYELRIKPFPCSAARCRYEMTANFVEAPMSNGRLLISQKQLRSNTVTGRLYGTLESIVRDTCARPTLLTNPINAIAAAFQ